MKRDQRQVQLSLKTIEKKSSLTSSLIETEPELPKKEGGRPNKSRQSKYRNTQIEEDERTQAQENKSKEKTKSKHKKFSWPIWKKLFQYSLKRKFHLFMGLILNICFALTMSLLPLKIGHVLDYITNTSTDQSQRNVDALKTSVYELGFMTLLLAFFTFGRFLSLQLLQQFLAMDMRNDFFRKFIENDLYFFQQYKSGELVSRLTSDVNQAKSAVSNNVAFLIRHIIIIFSNVIILFTISWKLTFLIMLLIPIYLFLSVHYSRRNKILVREYQDVQAEISAAVTEKFSGIQLVKAYSTQEIEIQRYSNIITKGYHINRKKIFLSGLYYSFSQFLPYMGIMMVLWYGGNMVIQGSSQLTAGELTSFILYSTSLANSTSSIANSYTNIINGTYAVQKVFQMLQYKPLVDESKGQNCLISGQIEFKNVTFKYPTSKTITLNNLSFNIKQGEYIAFVGESGSGKSTIVKLIQKFYQIQSGTINYGLHEQSYINAICLRKQMGLVNQDATIFSGTIQENITYGLGDFSLEDMEDTAERAGCMQFINDTKRFPKRFLSEVGEKGGNFSGGQKQRISIARALMRKPKVIIFDQATSALDSNSERMVQNSIESLAQNNRVDKPTIIVIAHRLSTVMNANRIFVMKNGEIVEEGSHRQLRELRGYYYQLIEKQLEDSPQLWSPKKVEVREQSLN